MNPTSPKTPARVVYSTLAAETIAQTVEATYPVGRIAAWSLIRRGFNDVYELRLGDGRRCVARLSGLRRRGDANIDYETALLLHLKAANARVAAPWRTSDGAAWIALQTTEGERTLAVFDFLDGEPPCDNLGDVQATGLGLARLHAAAQDYRGPASSYTLELPHLLERSLAALLPLPTLDDALRQQFAALADRVALRIGDMPGLQRVHCHGDVHGGNNVMTDGPEGTRQASFFDFDDGGPGFLAYDLSVYLWNMLLATPFADIGTNARWKHFLKGYLQGREIPEADFQAIAPFAIVRQFWLMGEFADRVDQWGTQSMPRAWLLRQANAMQSWETLATPGL
ncbi:phosphotransferase enzyme family protein [soil metagenome]